MTDAPVDRGPALTWRPGPPRPALVPGELHIWLARLDQPARTMNALLDTLAPDEQGRAACLRLESDRLRFVVGRGILRSILARYVDLSPGELRFDYSPSGKPGLAPPPGHSDPAVQFNLAHSAGLALYAIALGRRVGVDLERIDPGFTQGHSLERFLPASEAEAIRRLPPDKQTTGFFRSWTRREAVAKAIGTGLSSEIERFVARRLGVTAPLSPSGDPLTDLSAWSVHPIDVAPDFEAAAAIESPPSHIRTWLF